MGKGGPVVLVYYLFTYRCEVSTLGWNMESPSLGVVSLRAGVRKGFGYFGEMRLTIRVILLGIGMASGLKAREEIPVAKIEEVERWPEYAQAELTVMQEQKLKQESRQEQELKPRPVVEVLQVPNQHRQKLNANLRVIARRFGLELSEPFLFARNISDNKTRSRVRHIAKDGASFSLKLDDETEEVSSAYITLKKTPFTENDRPTKEQFLNYVKDCYLKVFNTMPQGDLFDQSIRSARWMVVVHETIMQSMASVDAGLKNSGDWHLMMNRGPLPDQVAAITKHLETQPTRVTRQQAIAIAWKNFKALQAPEAAILNSVETGIYCQLRDEAKTAAAEVIHWQDAKVWQNPQVVDLDPVVYEVSIYNNLFKATVLINRLTGKVIHIVQGRMSW